MFLAPATFLWWARVAGGLDRYSLSADLLLGRSTSDLGSVQLTLATLGGQVAVLTLQQDDWQFGLAPRAAFGRALAAGEPDQQGVEGSGVRELYFDGALGAQASYQVARRWSLGAGVEGGYARGLVAQAGDQEVARLGGWLLGVLLSVERH